MSSLRLTATHPLLAQNSYATSRSLDIPFDALLEEIDYEYEDSDEDLNGVFGKDVPISRNQDNEYKESAETELTDTRKFIPTPIPFNSPCIPSAVSFITMKTRDVDEMIENAETQIDSILK